MYLEGITVCVNYSDFLAQTLPHNKNQFDNFIVITDTKDSDTKKICEYHNVRCVQTDIFYEDGNIFNKGAAINYGLSLLEQKEWVLHIDADIYMPPMTRTILERLPLESHKIYGVDRLMCPSYEEWIKFIESPKHIQESWIFVHLDSFPMGTRIGEYMNYNSGWEPIGYFQLWNPKASGVTSYPTKHDYCDRTDVLHCKKFERKNRELLPEVVVIHLDSESGDTNMGKNWKGRKTKPFIYTPIFKKEVDIEIEKLYKDAERVFKKYNLDYIDIYVGNEKKSISKPTGYKYNRMNWLMRLVNKMIPKKES